MLMMTSWFRLVCLGTNLYSSSGTNFQTATVVVHEQTLRRNKNNNVSNIGSNSNPAINSSNNSSNNGKGLLVSGTHNDVCNNIHIIV